MRRKPARRRPFTTTRFCKMSLHERCESREKDIVRGRSVRQLSSIGMLATPPFWALSPRLVVNVHLRIIE